MKRYHWKKRATALTAGALILLLLGGGAALLAGGWQKPQQAQATLGGPPLAVNGEVITDQELALYVSLNRAIVADYFQRQHGAEYTSGFWRKEYAGEVPLSKLDEAVKAQLVRTKAELALAKRWDVEPDIGFAHFLKRLDAENERRAAALEANEPVYGPTRFDALSYYDYELALIRNATVEAMLAGGGISVSEEELQLLYEESRETSGAASGETVMQWASLAFGRSEDDMTRQQAYSRMQELEAALNDGESVVEAAGERNIPAFTAMLNGATRRSYALEFPMAISAADSLAEGETSAIVEERGSLHLIRIEARGQAVQRDLAEVRDTLTGRLAQSRYETIVGQEAESIGVEWSKEVAAERLAEALGLE